MSFEENQMIALRESSFDTLQNARNFIQWYISNKNHSEWDTKRYKEAIRLIKLGHRTPDKVEDSCEEKNIVGTFSKRSIPLMKLVNRRHEIRLPNE